MVGRRFPVRNLRSGPRAVDALSIRWDWSGSSVTSVLSCRTPTVHLWVILKPTKTNCWLFFYSYVLSQTQCRPTQLRLSLSWKIFLMKFELQYLQLCSRWVVARRWSKSLCSWWEQKDWKRFKLDENIQEASKNKDMEKKHGDNFNLYFFIQLKWFISCFLVSNFCLCAVLPLQALRENLQAAKVNRVNSFFSPLCRHCCAYFLLLLSSTK